MIFGLRNKAFFKGAFFALLILVLIVAFGVMKKRARIQMVERKVGIERSRNKILDAELLRIKQGKEIKQIKERPSHDQEPRTEGVYHAKASWYGYEHKGKRTSSGLIFNPEELTAAHRTLPFSTKVKIINIENGKEVVVTITDRGPARWTKRIIDLSLAAFREIADPRLGIIEVEFEILE